MNIYLIDTNCLITPKNTYYPFDFAEGFWKQLARTISENRVAVLGAVYKEIVNVVKSDNLAEWLKSQPDLKILEVSNVPEVLTCYGNILRYIQNSPRYNQKALNSWANEKVADAWLIAAAMHYGYTVVTLETPSKQSPNSISGKAYIPDVAAHFGVECITLFDFMRRMNFRL